MSGFNKRDKDGGMDLSWMGNSKTPPSWYPGCGVPIKEFATVVEVWETMTELKPKQRGGALAMRLGGKARTKAFKLGSAALMQEEVLADPGGQGRPPVAGQMSGVQVILAMLKTHYGEDEQKDVLDKLLKFFTCRRSRDEGHDDWKVRFEMVYEEAAGSGLALNITALTFLTMFWGGMSRPEMVNLLVPSEGKLPATDREQERLYAHMGRLKGFVGKSSPSEQAYFGRSSSGRKPFKPRSYDRGRSGSKGKGSHRHRSSTPGKGGRRSFKPRTFDRGRHFVMNSGSESDEPHDHDPSGDWYADGEHSQYSSDSDMPELGDDWRQEDEMSSSDSSSDAESSCSTDSDTREKIYATMKKHYQKKKGNPVGKDGKTYECHGCGSTEHMIRDCPKKPPHAHQTHAASSHQKDSRHDKSRDDRKPRKQHNRSSKKTHFAAIMLPQFDARDFEQLKPTLESAAIFNATELQGKAGIMPDSGAKVNVVGAKWLKRAEKNYLRRQGKKVQYYKSNPCVFTGVGGKTETSKIRAKMPILLGKVWGVFDRQVLPDSDLPAL